LITDSPLAKSVTGYGEGNPPSPTKQIEFVAFVFPLSTIMAGLHGAYIDPQKFTKSIHIREPEIAPYSA
jgi:hypothetical protein